MRMVRQLSSLLTTLTLAVSVAAPAPARDYPQRPVSLIIPVAAGTGADVIARVLAEQLGEKWGQQVVIVNRPGGAGAIGAQAAASATPDGYTLYMAVSSAFVVIPETKTKWPVDLATDFVPIGWISDQPMITAVAPSLGVNTLAEFIALAKRKPDDMLFGAARLSVPHLTGALLNERAGIKMRYIPTVGAAKVMQDILNGNLNVVTDSVPGIRGSIQNGTVKALAFTGEKRLTSFPDLPLASETLPNFNVRGWFVLMAPAKTPEDIVKQAREDLRETLEKPALRARYEQMGTFARPTSTVQEVQSLIEAEKNLWRPIVRQIETD
jgi:tripartite-type tricarboxylate transporter receptor subunit TctC